MISNDQKNHIIATILIAASVQLPGGVRNVLRCFKRIALLFAYVEEEKMTGWPKREIEKKVG